MELWDEILESLEAILVTAVEWIPVILLALLRCGLRCGLRGGRHRHRQAVVGPLPQAPRERSTARRADGRRAFADRGAFAELTDRVPGRVRHERRAPELVFRN